MTIAVWQGRPAQIVHDGVGRILLQFSDGTMLWVIRGAPDLEFKDAPMRIGRPRKYATNAARQRAYRERQKALRNSERRS